MDARLRSVGLNVRDFDGMVRFYRDRLGLPVARMVADRPDHKVCFFELGDGLFYLVWDNGAQATAGSSARVDLLVADVEGTYRALTSQGIECKGPPHPTRFGGNGFSVKDPEGTLIHLIERT